MKDYGEWLDVRNRAIIKYVELHPGCGVSEVEADLEEAGISANSTTNKRIGELLTNGILVDKKPKNNSKKSMLFVSTSKRASNVLSKTGLFDTIAELQRVVKQQQIQIEQLKAEFMDISRLDERERVLWDTIRKNPEFVKLEAKLIDSSDELLNTLRNLRENGT